MDDMVTDDYFLGRFSGPQRDYLDTIGLINREFCPLCGYQPIGKGYYRRLVDSAAVEYLCKECYKRTNPHLTIPGYTQRYLAVKAISWLVALGLIGLIFWLAVKVSFGWVMLLASVLLYNWMKKNVSLSSVDKPRIFRNDLFVLSGTLVQIILGLSGLILIFRSC